MRSTIFRHVLRVLCPLYMPRGFLPEHLELRDAFFVRYSAAPGHQRALETHTDGSIFSFNILLSDTRAFEGGGTWFEALDLTVTPPRGAALGHSGQLRHSGVEITCGERYILVGFIGSVAEPYSMHAADWAAHDAYLRFGAAAWERAAPAAEATLLHGKDAMEHVERGTST